MVQHDYYDCDDLFRTSREIFSLCILHMWNREQECHLCEIADMIAHERLSWMDKPYKHGGPLQ